MWDDEMGRSFRFRYTLVLLICVAVGLSACSSHQKPNIPYTNTTTKGAVTGVSGGAVLGAIGGFGGPVGAAIGGVAGTIVGHDMRRNQPKIVRLEKELAKAGVQFVRLGEDYKLILPSDYFFYIDGPRLNYTGRFYLNVVAEYLRLFKTMSIKISGFTDNKGMPERNRAMSNARAQQVVEYLSKHNLDVRLISTYGYGADYPIATNKTPQGRALNRRVEITFRLLQPTTIV